jgi:hypothetical protein
MEEATGAPSSFAVYDPRRLRASGRDGGGVMSRPPSPLTMLVSGHARRREFIAGFGSAVALLWRRGRSNPRCRWSGFSTLVHPVPALRTAICSFKASLKPLSCLAGTWRSNTLGK